MLIKTIYLAIIFNVLTKFCTGSVNSFKNFKKVRRRSLATRESLQRLVSNDQINNKKQIDLILEFNPDSFHFYQNSNFLQVLNKNRPDSTKYSNKGRNLDLNNLISQKINPLKLKLVSKLSDHLWHFQKDIDQDDQSILNKWNGKLKKSILRRRKRRSAGSSSNQSLSKNSKSSSINRLKERIQRSFKILQNKHYFLEILPSKSRNFRNNKSNSLTYNNNNNKHRSNRLRRDNGDYDIEQDLIKPSEEFQLILKNQSPPNDPNWKDMWYLHRPNYKTGYYHLNVTAAWALGYTGAGITVTILDDGIERNHPDLMENYDASASYDFNSNDADPMPRYNPQNENRHGTRCAGEVAAIKDNNICVPGIAYKSNIGGIRMLDGDVTDVVEMKSVSHSPQTVDIYSSSWGPDDDGKTVDGPGRLTKQAFIDGTEKGRNGKGSIFVWASGNGGRYHDSCSCDGYCNSIYTITVSSTTQNERIPWYSEKCSSTLTSTYSSGTRPEENIITTDLRMSCTTSHTGTSASAPIAAAICALVLEANPSLTWRDMQHLIVQTSNPYIVKSTGEYVKNGAGLWFSHAYGFGVMDAGRMCEVARNWINVPPMRLVSSLIYSGIGETWTGTDYVKEFEIGHQFGDDQKTDMSDFKLETVSPILTIQFPYRGYLEIYLTSPAGSRSQLLFKRQSDRSSQGFKKWQFMSVMYWGENPVGTWKLEIKNVGSTPSYKGTLLYFNLQLTGTKEMDWNIIKDKSSEDDSNNLSSEDQIKLTVPEENQIDDETPKLSETETKNTSIKPITVQNCRDQNDETESCVECMDTYFLHEVQNACLESCPAGFAEQTEPRNFCEKCHESCKTCTGSLKTQCTDCFEGFDLNSVNMCLEIRADLTEEQTENEEKDKDEEIDQNTTTDQSLRFVENHDDDPSNENTIIDSPKPIFSKDSDIKSTIEQLAEAAKIQANQAKIAAEEKQKRYKELSKMIADSEENSMKELWIQCIIVGFVISACFYLIKLAGCLPRFGFSGKSGSSSGKYEQIPMDDTSR